MNISTLIDLYVLVIFTTQIGLWVLGSRKYLRNFVGSLVWPLFLFGLVVVLLNDKTTEWTLERFL